jgi:hypothetical protein
MEKLTRRNLLACHHQRGLYSAGGDASSSGTGHRGADRILTPT